MGAVRRNRLQIRHVLLLTRTAPRRGNDVPILLLEHPRKKAVLGPSVGVVLPVVRDLVDEEEGQHLDAPAEQPPLPLDVGEDRFADLDAAQPVLVQPADRLSGAEPDTVQELHGVVPAVDGLHDEAVPVLLQPAGALVEVVADARRPRDLPNARHPLAIELNRRGRGRRPGEVEALKVDVALRRGALRFRDALDGDSLHQPLVVGLHRAQPIDQVVEAVGPVGCGVAQRHQGVELPQHLPGPPALDGLGFVDDHDRMGSGDDLDRPPRPELVKPHVNAPRVLPPRIEGLRVDDHDVDGAVRRKPVDLRHLHGVVDEVSNLPTVLLRKMVLHDLEGLVDALADRDAGDDDDELAPAVPPVQLIEGLDVGVGLAGSRLHLDR